MTVFPKTRRNPLRTAFSASMSSMAGRLRAGACIAVSLCLALVSCRHEGDAVCGMTLLETEARDGYECRYIELNAGGDAVRAFLLVPDAAQDTVCPALLMLHDHGARFDIGKEKLVRPLRSASVHIRNSSRQWVDKYFDGVYFADAMAASGYVVLVTDALYWGERSSGDADLWSRMAYGDSPCPVSRDSLKVLKKRVFEGQRAVYDSLQSTGILWAEKILDDDKAAAAFLASLPFVDRERTGAFGFSMGAHRCWLLSAFSEDIRAGAAVCWMLMKEDYDDSSVSDLSMRMPELRAGHDFPDIASLTYPKPMLFINGRDDSLFPMASAEKAFARMREIYAEKSADGTAGMMETVFADCGHHCGRPVQEKVSDFFGKAMQ